MNSEPMGQKVSKRPWRGAGSSNLIWKQKGKDLRDANPISI